MIPLAGPHAVAANGEQGLVAVAPKAGATTDDLVDQARGRNVLTAGAVSARLENTGHNTRVRAGSRGFIDLYVRNTTKSTADHIHLSLIHI